ncbi:MAG: PorT family protein [Bacteroidales bacterium]|nr:PorT family protein [Bacteroidales bacterium]MDD3700989.1 outer membrane beta-barrel protein [Bacteroidales bacterium]
MQKRLLLCIVVVVFVGLRLDAQIIKGFATVGFNLSQVDGDEAYGYRKIGGNGGLGVMIPFWGNFDVAIETSLTQKGAYQRPQYFSLRGDDTLTGAYDLRLNYAEIPLMVQYTDKNFISAGIGVVPAVLISAKEFEHGRQTPTTALSGTYARMDYSILLDAKMRIKGRLWGNFRFQYSMQRIRTREFSSLGGTETWIRHQYNNMISFRLFYIFNEDQSLRAVKEKKPEL